jgi:hypothetical protein
MMLQIKTSSVFLEADL